MCLGIPGKIIACYELEGTPMCKVEFGGVQQEVCLATTPEASMGDYILVHAGFALNILSDEEAAETLSLLEQIQAFNDSHPEAKDDKPRTA
ncbi:MAG: HypC/HybG/HupF family hydrogenase formation chaperone [Anaerolineaceae bacterium]|nr:HypC/HybG/HupF family hydrogenase formation chaperone [Anaerolineaceae bacterium]